MSADMGYVVHSRQLDDVRSAIEDRVIGNEVEFSVVAVDGMCGVQDALANNLVVEVEDLVVAFLVDSYRSN